MSDRLCAQPSTQRVARRHRAQARTHPPHQLIKIRVCMASPPLGLGGAGGWGRQSAQPWQREHRQMLRNPDLPVRDSVHLAQPGQCPTDW